MLSHKLARFFTWGSVFPNRNLYVGAGQKYNARFKDYFSQHMTYGLDAHEHTYTHTSKDYRLYRPWDAFLYWFKINIAGQWDFFTYRYFRAMDIATMVVLPMSFATFLVLGEVVYRPFYVYSGLSVLVWYYRVREKVSHPEVDELEIKDFLYSNETVKKYFSDLTSYVIDVSQEYDKFNLDEYSEYKNNWIARMFNVDCNTTKGFLKMCDLETDARMTIHFKTMPWSASKHYCSHPFMIIDLWAEINCKGVYEKIVFIDPKKVNKKIFLNL